MLINMEQAENLTYLKNLADKLFELIRLNKEKADDRIS